MYFLFSISYCICFVIWSANIIEILRGRTGFIGVRGAGELTKPVVHTIHYLMAILLLLKFLSVFFDSIRYYKIQVSGHAEFLSFIYYTFTVLKGMFLFTVILLIGTGWSFVKSSLSTREKKVILFVLILQIINNVALAVLSQETVGEKYFAIVSGLMHMIDIICCCAVIVPVVWQVNELEKIVDNDSSENEHNSTAAQDIGSKSLILKRLKIFRTFYMLVVAYIYATRILVYLFASILSYKNLWIQHFVVEIVTLSFYVVVGIMFRPQEVEYDKKINQELESLRHNNDIELT
jgi:G protein-coupled receptor 107